MGLDGGSIIATSGKLTGGQTTTEVFYGLDGTTVRVTSTVDEDGNRVVVFS